MNYPLSHFQLADLNDRFAIYSGWTASLWVYNGAHRKLVLKLKSNTKDEAYLCLYWLKRISCDSSWCIASLKVSQSASCISINDSAGAIVIEAMSVELLNEYDSRLDFIGHQIAD
jgi:hypothetical protein